MGSLVSFAGSGGLGGSITSSGAGPEPFISKFGGVGLFVGVSDGRGEELEVRQLSNGHGGCKNKSQN